MNSLAELREAVTAHLRGDARLAGCRVTPEYPAERRDSPLRRPVIAVGLDSIRADTAMGGLTDGLGMAAPGALCSITVRIDILTAPLDKGNRPHALMELIWDRLFLAGNPFGFAGFQSAALTWDKAMECSRLTCRGILRAALAGSGDGGGPYPETFRVVQAIEPSQGPALGRERS